MIRPLTSRAPSASSRSPSLLRVRILRKPLARGQGGPRGSSGRPQKGQGGRPAATTARARLEKALASPAVQPHHVRPRRSPPPPARIRGVLVLLCEREHLDDDTLVVRVPRERHRPGAELLDDGLFERPGVLQVDRRDRRDGRARPPPCGSARRGSSSIRSASTETCCFSRRHAGDAGTERAWRKNARWPGGPTVPATNRSGGRRRARRSWDQA